MYYVALQEWVIGILELNRFDKSLTPY
jgi:hypothetical protein